MKTKRWSIVLPCLFSLTIALGCALTPTSIPAQPTATLPPTVPSSPVPPTDTPEPTAAPTETEIPSPTPLPGKVVLPVDTLGKGVPWLPLDENYRPVVQYVAFNTVKAPFNSATLRQALAYAVDRDVLIDMVKSYGARDAVPASVLTPPQVLGRDLYGEVGITYDPGKARELFAKTGYSDPSAFPKAVFLVNASGEVAPGARYNMATAMSNMWKDVLGISIEVQAVGSFTYYGEQLANNPPDIFWIGWIADYNDPANFVGELFYPNGDYHGEYNYGQFSNSEFTVLISRALVSHDPAERQVLYIQAERILCELEAAVIPIYFNTGR
jgi:ABC-type oligopeptide transport system substrate-binding subunit